MCGEEMRCGEDLFSNLMIENMSSVGLMYTRQNPWF